MIDPCDGVLQVPVPTPHCLIKCPPRLSNARTTRGREPKESLATDHRPQITLSSTSPLDPRGWLSWLAAMWPTTRPVPATPPSPRTSMDPTAALHTTSTRGLDLPPARSRD